MTDPGAQLVPDPAGSLYRVTAFKSTSSVVLAMTRRSFPGAAAADLQPGVFAGDAGRAQRAEFARQVSIEIAHTIWLDPDDSGEVVFCSETDRGRGAADWESRVRGASGIVSEALDLFLCTLYNDNMVVLLFDPVGYGIGLVNVAADQTKGDAISEAVALLAERTGANPARMQALIGPSIGPCCRTFPDAVGSQSLSNLWDLARSTLLEAGLLRGQIFNPRVCTACADTEFFTRRVDGPDAGIGAMVFGVRDSSSLRTSLRMRRAAQRTRRQQTHATPQEVSLTEEQIRLNRLIRCPYGQKKVYIRSVIDGKSDETSKPHLALRCAVMEHVGQAMGGYNIVQKDYIEKICCADYAQCQAYQELHRRKAKE
jgi:hypothetical protein